ncbi:MAG: hypothetical protein OEY51_06300 [Cyclobacteriaceae bacterium]|nr:hypothetical protein [Cyclobacteriaceae bacterium]
MKIVKYSIYIMVLIVNYTFGQGFISSTQNSSLGYSTPSKHLTKIIFNNPGSLAKAESGCMIFSLENLYSFPGLFQMYSGVLLKLPFGNTSAGFYRLGGGTFSHQEIFMGYANTLGLVSLGLKAKVIQWHIDPLVTIYKPGIDFGGLATISPKWLFGAYVININYPLLSRDNLERAPMAMMAGVAYLPTDKVLLQAEIRKQIDHYPGLNTGLEYALSEAVSLNTGIATNPIKNRFGILFTLQKIHFEYLTTFQFPLGQSHLWSLTYKL